MYIECPNKCGDEKKISANYENGTNGVNVEISDNYGCDCELTDAQIQEMINDYFEN